jgi:hypothetical protein
LTNNNNVFSDDPYFKFIAEYQVYTDVREFTIYDDPEIVDEFDYPEESRKGNDDWQAGVGNPTKKTPFLFHETKRGEPFGICLFLKSGRTIRKFVCF